MLLKRRISLSYVFGKVKWEMLFISVYTIILAFLFYKFNMTHLTIPIAVPMIMGTVISLLLGFRSNQAYDRWWEARIVWGSIVNDSRSVTRQLLSFTNAVKDPELKPFIRKFVFRQIAWTHALGRSLRGRDPLKYLQPLLTQEEFIYISRYKNKPNALLELHAYDLAYMLEKGWINMYQQMNIDQTLSKFSDSMGKCERIKNTIFPATYSFYIHLALNFFLMMLPFSLIGIFGILEVPFVIAVATIFILIEKMAIHLQDPFENHPTDTPVTTIANNIERDLQQMINEDAGFIPPHEPDPLDNYPYHGRPYYQM